MVTDSSDFHTTWHGPVFKQVKSMLVQFRERSSGPSAKKKKYFGKYPFIKCFSQCEWNTSSRNILWEPWFAVSALRAWKWLFQGLSPGSHTLQSIAFSLFWGEAEFLLSAALLTCFLANIRIQRTSSCWENGLWGNFRDISSWREVAAALGAPQNCGQLRNCSCLRAALGAAKWLLLDLTQEGDNRECVCCVRKTDCTRQGN